MDTITPEAVPAEVITPEVTSAAPAVVYAGFWRRVAAILVDDAVVAVPYVVILFVCKALIRNGTTFTHAYEILSIIFALAWIVYAIVLESSPRRATVGKRLMGLAVTDNLGARITVGRAAGRFFAKLVPFLFLIAFGLASEVVILITIFGGARPLVVALAILVVLITLAIPVVCYGMAGWTKKKQALHDKIAKTLVIKERSAKNGPVVILIILLVAAMVSFNYAIKDIAPAPSAAPVSLVPAGVPAGTAPTDVKFTLPDGYTMVKQTNADDPEIAGTLYEVNHGTDPVLVVNVDTDAAAYTADATEFQGEHPDLLTDASGTIGGQPAATYLSTEPGLTINREIFVPSKLATIIVSSATAINVPESDIDSILGSVTFQ
jgi:uncharacterized RDD family membrane protein YckC